MLASPNIFIVCALAAAALTGCATPYQPQSLLGGLSETQLGPDVYKIYFNGNGFTSRQRAQDFVMLRGAELCLKSGYHYFGLMSSADGATGDTFTAGSYGRGGFFAASGTVWKPRSDIFVRFFRDKPKDGFVLDAKFIYDSLRSKYQLDQPQPASAPRPTSQSVTR